jgi:hypothetical protein
MGLVDVSCANPKRLSKANQRLRTNMALRVKRGRMTAFWLELVGPVIEDVNDSP